MLAEQLTDEFLIGVCDFVCATTPLPVWYLDDARQSAYLAAFQERARIHKLDSGRILSFWRLVRYIRRRTIDAARAELKQKHEDECLIEGRKSKAPGIPEIAEHKETEKRLANAVRHLDNMGRQLIRLRFREGLSYSEMATELGLSKSGCQKLTQKALRRIRDGAG